MLVVLLLIIFAIIDFGRLLYVKQAVSSASREGARAGVISTARGNTVFTAANNAVAAAASLAGGTATTQVTKASGVTTAVTAASTTYVPCDAAGNTMTVTVTVAPFRWFTPVGIFSSGINNVSAATTMRCE